MTNLFADTVLMVRPAAFASNEQTQRDNHFQKGLLRDQQKLQHAALAEFDRMTAALREAGITVVVVQDDTEVAKPDAIFPNNWFTCMHGTLTLFPMMAENRRAERTAAAISTIKSTVPDLQVSNLSAAEAGNEFLEGTGSMVIDHAGKVIYACRSERTNPRLLAEFARDSGYSTVLFDAHDSEGRAIYHTNVLMCIGNGFAVLCNEALNPSDLGSVTESLRAAGLELISISFDQMNAFAGNMLQLQNTEGRHLLAMSNTAYGALSADQRSLLESKTDLVVIDIPTIETAGGGGVRCMMAELFSG